MISVLTPKLVIPIAIAFLLLPCSAQQKETTTLRFVTFPTYAGGETIELLTGEGKMIPIELPTNSLSPAYQIENIRKCVLGEETVDEEGKPSFDIYGQAPMLGSRNQIILVIRKGEKLSDGLELTAFDGGQNGFNGGKYILMNASTVDIAGNLGTSKFALKPDSHVLLAPKASEEKNGRKYLYTTVYFRKGKVTRPFYSSTWRLSDAARCMVFFHHDPHTKQIRTHTIRSYIE